MQNFQLTLEYDGSGFFGFQKQPNHPTIQEALEKALSRLFNRKMKIASASGRTDTGVHAENQIVNFKVGAGLKPAPTRSIDQILRGLNAYLPPAIAVKKVEKVPISFHARFQAKSKIYEYRIWNHPVRSPLQAARTFHYPYPLNISLIRKGAKMLTCRSDFKAFCSSGGSDEESTEKKNTVRTIRSFRIAKQGNLISFRVEADGFLHHMVRNLAGTLLELGRGKISPDEIKRILVSKDRRKAGMTVPAHGLTLIRVKY